MPAPLPYRVLGILLLAGLLSACENDANQVNNLNRKKMGVEEAKDVRVVYTLGGKTKAILTAPLMLNVQDTTVYVEFPKTIHTDFYNEAGINESKLDALYAKYKRYENIIFIRDSVRVINMLRGDTLYCNELYWNRSRVGNEFYTDKPVRIRTKTQILNGIGMESSQDFKNWHIIQTTGVISVPAARFPG